MTNETKFTGKAGLYAKYRPSYPQALMDDLKQIISPKSLVADIGAGTGIFSECLLKNIYQVIAVEPNAEMRKVLYDNLGDKSNLEIRSASAEKTGLHINSVDFITVAQAFHWFEEILFKNECKRILKLNAKVALIWNKGVTCTLAKEYQLINEKHCPDFNGLRQERTAQKIKLFFRDGLYEVKAFFNPLSLTENGFIGKALSSSYAPKKEDLNFERYVTEMLKLFHHYQHDGLVSFPNVTTAYVGQV